MISSHSVIVVDGHCGLHSNRWWTRSLAGVMARGSGWSGSYREWEAAQRAEDRAAQQQEKQHKAREREDARSAAVGRDEDAQAKTLAIERRVADLEGLLRSSLGRDPRVSLDSLRHRVDVPSLDLGELAVPFPAPQWADFEPEPVRGLRRMFGGQQQYEAAVEAAARAFRRAEEDHQRREGQRCEQVAEAGRAHQRKIAESEREVATHNAHIDEMAAGLRENDRLAVSEYVQTVLDRSPYPAGFPAERSAGYVPESSLLAVEWYLPPVEVVPEQKAFRHVKTRKVVEPTARPLAEIRQIYKSVIAQIALRTLREVFDSVPDEMITVASGIGCKSDRRGSGFMVMLGGSADSFGAVGVGAGGDGAWPQLGGWFEE